ncbi:MAG: ribulose phosphate epimerase [Myxococcales bacterium]|nr:ribulose phosphate epimerase [Myxococcales bacterium]
MCPPDDPSGPHECDMFAQDCPDGEKCMPWANDGGNAWNATRCSPVVDNPAQPGDMCTVEGSGVSGIDSCDLGSMCWDVDSETNTGTCAPMCTGSEASPVCDDPDTTCINVNDGAIVLCLPLCDPLLQDCSDGSACYGIQESFTCVPDASGPMGLYGDPCEYINACDPGLFCADATLVPNCQGSAGCCSEFCDLDDPACSGAGQECVAWSDNPQPGMELVGGCAIP